MRGVKNAPVQHGIEKNKDIGPESSIRDPAARVDCAGRTHGAKRVACRSGGSASMTSRGDHCRAKFAEKFCACFPRLRPQIALRMQDPGKKRVGTDRRPPALAVLPRDFPHIEIFRGLEPEREPLRKADVVLIGPVDLLEIPRCGHDLPVGHPSGQMSLENCHHFRVDAFLRDDGLNFRHWIRMEPDTALNPSEMIDVQPFLHLPAPRALFARQIKSQYPPQTVPWAIP